MTPSASRRAFLRYAIGAGAALLATGGGVARADPLDHSWVTTTRATPLLIDPEAADQRWLPRGTLLRVAPGASGARLHAWCPAFATFGSVEASAVEDAPAPSETELLAQRTGSVLPPGLVAGELPGRVVGSANVRIWPDPRRDTLVRQLRHNVEVGVLELVEGDDGEPWYRIGEAAGQDLPRGSALFVHSNFIRVPRTDFHPTSANPDRGPRRWFEADLQEPTLLSAWENDRPIWSSLAIRGKQGELTPQGDHRVLWRIPRETMTSERVHPPIPRNMPGGYYLENVLYTQYFYRNGAAIHYNYWASSWGYAGSRGCLGLPLAESKWAWDWAETGTPVKVFS